MLLLYEDTAFILTSTENPHSYKSKTTTTLVGKNRMPIIGHKVLMQAAAPNEALLEHGV